MQMPGRNASTGDYRYGFNGQETDDEITGSESHVSYKYRMHDARLGRFLSPDPYLSSFPALTPYQFAINSPIAFIDYAGGFAVWAAGGPILIGEVTRSTLTVAEEAQITRLIKAEMSRISTLPPAPDQGTGINPFKYIGRAVGLTIGFFLIPKQATGLKTQYSFGPTAATEILTTDPSTLSREYLRGVLQRNLTNTTRESDGSYLRHAREVRGITKVKFRREVKSVLKQGEFGIPHMVVQDTRYVNSIEDLENVLDAYIEAYDLEIIEAKVGKDVGTRWYASSDGKLQVEYSLGHSSNKEGPHIKVEERIPSRKKPGKEKGRVREKWALEKQY
jgi:RHS repeat-associated protein